MINAARRASRWAARAWRGDAITRVERMASRQEMRVEAARATRRGRLAITRAEVDGGECTLFTRFAAGSAGGECHEGYEHEKS